MNKKKSNVYPQHVSSVLEFIYRNENASRIGIANATGLTPALITSISSDLMEQHLIIETGDEFSRLPGSGRKRKLLTLNPAAGYLVGVEINMTGIFATLTDLMGHIISQNHIVTASYDVKNINGEIISQISSVIKDIEPEEIFGAGIAVPGHFDYRTQTIVTNNPLWKSFHLEEISEHFSFPFMVDNNIECMSLGEYLFNAPDTPDKFLFYHIGHGLFCSFFNAGQPGIKSNHYIGEIGHTVVDINGPVCECGKKGCLQTYISESWLIKNARFLFLQPSNNILQSLVGDEESITIDTIIKAYELGDSYFGTQIDLGIKLLSVSIANTLMIQDVDKIYLNSRLLHHNTFQHRLISLIQEQLNFIPTMRNIEIEFVEFDDYRGSIGACALASFSFFIKNKYFEAEGSFTDEEYER